MIDPTYFEVLNALAVPAAAGALAYWLGLRRRPTDAREDSDRIAFLEAMGYSLQCVNEVWAVTDNCGKIVGMPCDTLRAAIESASAGWMSDVGGAGNV